MPALTGQPALDVAIGLFFVFFLLSVLCSAVNEAIATALAWRSETLLAALRSMLAEDGDVPARPRQSAGQATDASAGAQVAQSLTPARQPDADSMETRVMPSAATTAAIAAVRPIAEPPEPGPLLERVLDHPLIRSQVDETARQQMRRSVPSYLQSRTFALALLDTLDGAPGADDNAFGRARTAIARIPNPQVKGALTTLVNDAAGDVDRLRDGVEGWFDATMQRASGWYKRRTQLSLWVIAAVVTLAFNADAGQIASALWKDPILRSSVAAQAQQAASKGDQSDIINPGAGEADSKDPTLTARIDRVRQLNLPLGWSVKKADPRWPDNAWGFIAKFIGLLATVVALSMGAPFWFDLLGRVSRVRGTGVPPAPSATRSQ